MITTKDELFKSAAKFSLVRRTLAASLYTSTKNRKLKELLDSGRGPVLISKELKLELQQSLETKKQNMDKARESRKGKGGRPRLPDPANPDNLTGAELRKYKNREWQRSWRSRNSKTEVQA